MDRTKQRELQHIGLPTAAAVIYHQVTKALLPLESAGLRHVLNDVAHAVSIIAPIFSGDQGEGLPCLIPEEDLLGCIFSKGASVLTTARGKQYGLLTIQRRDMTSAVTLLIAAKINLPRES